MYEILPDHPEIRICERTGYTSWNQPSDWICGRCERIIPEDEVAYKDSYYDVLCTDCLLEVHDRW